MRVLRVGAIQVVAFQSVLCRCMLLASLAYTSVGLADEQFVLVADPFIEMHTGPGSGYPITQIVERGERVAILKRRTEWFKIRGPRGNEGWAHRDQMQRTLQPSGRPADFPDATEEAWRESRWSAGLLAGDFGGAEVYTALGAYRMSRHLSAELSASQILGDLTDGWAVSLNVVHTFKPEWRVSPFFSLGAGVVHIDPKSALALPEDSTDQAAVVGAGVSAYLSRRLVLRAEYKGYVVLTSRNDNEDVDEWKAGFTVFF